MQPLPCEIRSKIDNYKRASEAKIGRLEKQPYEPRSLPGTLSTYTLPSFSHFVANG